MLTVFYLKNDVSSNTTILAFNSLNLKIRTLQKRKKKSQISGSKFCFPLSLEWYDPVRYVNEFHY